MPLKPGAVEPAGWLRDWSISARDGITGHLDESHATFRDGWKGIPIDTPGVEPNATGWPLEQSAYWLDGALRLGFVLHDESLIAKIRKRLDPIVDGVNHSETDTTFIYWVKDYKPVGFNSWAHSQLGRAMVALYQGTGDRRVLDALVKVYAHYPEKMGCFGQTNDVQGICNWDAMLETYRLSGDRRILDRIKASAAQPEIVRDVQAWNDGNYMPGHAVIYYENARLPALLYPWTGDSRYLNASLGALKYLDQKHMLPYGVSSGEEFLPGIGAFRKTETCDVAAMLWTSAWMYRILGDREWGDRMEKAFFNAAPAPIARDFKTMSYYQSPNRLQSDSLPCQQPHCPGPAGNRFSPLGCPTVLCCVAVCNRIIPNYIIHMWMATQDNGLAATLYGPNKVSTLVGDNTPVTIETVTSYPFEESICMTVDPQQDAAFPLYLRIPTWCKDAKIAVNGQAVSQTTDAKGFVKIARTWTKGDRIELQLPMKPRVERGFETEYPMANHEYYKFMPAEVFKPRLLPYADVVYGPLLFSLAIPDVNPDTPVKDAKWQYALDIDAMKQGEGIQIDRKPMPAHWDWPLDAPLALLVPAKSFDWQPTDAQALPPGPVAGNSAESIRLVPYGCTKFRISMFPITKN